jgi:hypothetical protein
MRIKNQELMLELDIALAGLELPYKPQTEMTSEEKFEYILSLIKPNVKKNDEKLSQYETAKETHHIKLEETAKRARLMPASERKPDLSRIKILFVEYLNEISRNAGDERNLINNISESRNWELKARSTLFLEASKMIEGIPCGTSLAEFIEGIIMAMADKTKNNDWGWGSNWSNSIHVKIMCEVHSEVIDFLKLLT